MAEKNRGLKVYVAGSSESDPRIYQAILDSASEYGNIVGLNKELRLAEALAAQPIRPFNNLTAIQEADCLLGDITNYQQLSYKIALMIVQNKPVGVFVPKDLEAPSAFKRSPLIDIHTYTRHQVGADPDLGIKEGVRATLRTAADMRDMQEDVGNQLKQRTREAIERKLIQTGSLSFDMRLKRVLHHDYHVVLDPIEYVIAEAWAKNLGSFNEKNHILRECKTGNLNFDIDPEIVSKYSRRAAHKLNAFGKAGHKYVEQDSGRYRLKPYVNRVLRLPILVETGPLCIDMTNLRAWMNDEKLFLKKPGMLLLTALAENIGTDVQRADIYAKVWPGQDVPDSRFSTALRTLKGLVGDAKEGNTGLILHKKGTVQLVDRRDEETPT